MSEKSISPLRRRMIEDMTVRNFVEKTRNDYIRHVRTSASVAFTQLRGAQTSIALGARGATACNFPLGFRTPATVQAASLRSAGIRNPTQKRTHGGAAKKTSTNLVGCSTDLGCERVLFPEVLLAHKGLGNKMPPINSSRIAIPKRILRCRGSSNRSRSAAQGSWS